MIFTFVYFIPDAVLISAHCKIPVGEIVKKFYLCVMGKRKEKIDDTIIFFEHFAPYCAILIMYWQLLIILTN